VQKERKMRKKAILLAFAVVLVIGCVAGSIAYAATSHSPPKGHKLVGMGYYGVSAEVETLGNLARSRYVDTAFDLTNPNCSKNISITYVSVMDEDGNVVAEGTPAQLSSHSVPAKLGPHEFWSFSLAEFFTQQPLLMGDSVPPYTVEISWTGNGDRPLTGWCHRFMETFKFVGGYDPNIPFEQQVDDADTEAWETEMVNFSS
jgi:hypothetical protein